MGAVEESLHRRLAEAPAALVGALLVVDYHPGINISLQHLDAVVEFLAEGNPVELVEQRLMEPLADTVSLRAARLSPGVVDILHCEVELILVPVVGAAILGTAIG